MNKQSKKFLWLLLMVVIWVFSCGPTAPVPVVPTPIPGLVETIIADTQAAIANQTASAIPTATMTPTVTATPTRTPTETPTSTPTFVFSLFSPTAPKSYLNGGGTGYNCMVLSVTPDIIKINEEFDARWSVKNTGTNTWQNTSVDYAYFSGTAMHKHAAYDLETTVASGGTTTLIVDMVAPAQTGYFTTVWVMRRGKINFCQLSMTIYVGK
jgi:hypothetical protein